MQHNLAKDLVQLMPTHRNSKAYWSELCDKDVMLPRLEAAAERDSSSFTVTVPSWVTMDNSTETELTEYWAQYNIDVVFERSDTTANTAHDAHELSVVFSWWHQIKSATA